MEILIRAVAIFIEVILLALIIYCLLAGVWLTVFDLGIGPKYKKAIAMALVLVGCIVLTFLIAHLTTFYPTIVQGG